MPTGIKPFMQLRTLSKFFSATILLASTTLHSANALPAWTYNIIHQFCSAKDCSDGIGPQGPVLMGTREDLYGAAGDGKCGVIFQATRHTRTWLYSVIYRFNPNQ